MDKKVVSISAWKKERNAPTVPASTPQPKGPTLRIGLSSVGDMIMGIVEKVESHCKDNHFTRMGACLSVESRLAGLSSPQNPRKISQYRALVQGYEDELLFRLLREATDSDLSARPTFYAALVEEAKMRVL